MSLSFYEVSVGQYLQMLGATRPKYASGGSFMASNETIGDAC